MKRLYGFFMIVVLLTVTFRTTAFFVHAKSEDELKERGVRETIEYFEDGSYMIITVSEEIKTARGIIYDIKGGKDIALHDKTGGELWRFTIYGSFSVNPGISATCTAASYSVSIQEDAWQNESASAYCSGNQAIGDANFIRKLLGITVESKYCHVVLTCDSNGNLS